MKERNTRSERRHANESEKQKQYKASMREKYNTSQEIEGEVKLPIRWEELLNLWIENYKKDMSNAITRDRISGGREVKESKIIK